MEPLATIRRVSDINLQDAVKAFMDPGKSVFIRLDEICCGISIDSQRIPTALGGSDDAKLDVRELFPPMANEIGEKLVFPEMSAQDFFLRNLSDAAPNSMERFLRERGDESVQFQTWNKVSAFDPPSFLTGLPGEFYNVPTYERSYSFVTAIKVPVGPNRTDVSVVERAIWISDRCVVVESKMHLLDVPFSDRFHVVSRKFVESTPAPGPLAASALNPWRADGSENFSPETSLLVEFEVQFTRPCNFKKRIMASLTKKIRKLMDRWCTSVQEDYNRERLASHCGGSGPLLDRVSEDDEDEDDEGEDDEKVTQPEISKTEPPTWQPLADDEENSENTMLKWIMKEDYYSTNDARLDSTIKEFKIMEWRPEDGGLTELTDDDILSPNCFEDEECGIEVCDTGTTSTEATDGGHQYFLDLLKAGKGSKNCAGECEVEIVVVGLLDPEPDLVEENINDTPKEKTEPQLELTSTEPKKHAMAKEPLAPSKRRRKSRRIGRKLYYTIRRKRPTKHKA